MQRNLSVTLLACLYLAFVDSASAGSLIEKHLGSLTEVSVTLLAPRYEPIPGDSPDKLESMLKARATAILVKNGLKISDSSRQRLVIKIEVARHQGGHGALSLSILSELREPAVLSRNWERTGEEELEVTSWSELRLVAAPCDKHLEQLIEAVELEAIEFAEKVRQAKPVS